MTHPLIFQSSSKALYQHNTLLSQGLNLVFELKGHSIVSYTFLSRFKPRPNGSRQCGQTSRRQIGIREAGLFQWSTFPSRGLEGTCEEVGSLLEIEPDVLLKKCVTEQREILIAAIYEAVVDWIIVKLNEAIRNEMKTGQMIGSSSGSDAGMATPPSSQEDAVSASITVVEVPSSALAKALSLKTTPLEFS